MLSLSVSLLLLEGQQYFNFINSLKFVETKKQYRKAIPRFTVLNKRKISKFQGEDRKMNKDRGYTHEEIKLLADTG